ncbi:MAG: 30S ribosome-binding factor RbfA [Endomicrobium sp.]|jgi:ribosome-binding factor A|nr:30S ribosome-binding factor RbfA [Endomicrobium sp.]
MSLLYKRSVRVSGLIHRIVAEIIREMRNLDTKKFVTITNVKLTDDLLNCKVYYSVFGTKEDKEKADRILKKNVKNVRYQLALRLNLRRTPAISFVYDYTNENASKIFDILRRIEEEN